MHWVWVMYADDYEDTMCPNAPAGAPPNAVWVASTYMNWTTSAANNNTAFLDNALLAPYCEKVTKIYKCPSDRERAQNGDRLRSFSMNSQMGASGGINPGPPPTPYTPPNYSAGWKQFKKTTELTDLKPSDGWIFTEEHPDSINDGFLQMSLNSVNTFVDVPGANHGGSGTFSFADGHVEGRRWTAPPPPVRKIVFQNFAASASDWQWVAERTSVRQ